MFSNKIGGEKKVLKEFPRYSESQTVTKLGYIDEMLKLMELISTSILLSSGICPTFAYGFNLNRPQLIYFTDALFYLN